MLKTALLGLSLMFCATIVQADKIHCEMTRMHNSGGWIPPEIWVDYDLKAESAKIIRPKEFTPSGKKQNGKIAVHNDKRITFTFKVKNAYSQTGQHANFLYRLTRYKKDDSAILTAIPVGYANKFTAKGRCKPA